MEIIRNKPIPGPVRAGGGRPVKYPFATMEVGDCFRVGSFRSEAERVRGAMKSHVKNRSGAAEFTVRKDGDSYFCWRIR